MPTREVDTPGVARWVEGQRLERDRRFRGPALAVAFRGRIPDSFPVPVLAIGFGVDRFASHAIRVDVEHVAAAALVVGIERDREAVLAEGDVALVQDLRDYLIRLGVPESRGEIQVVVVVGNVDPRALARLPNSSDTTMCRSSTNAASCQTASSSRPSSTGGCSVRIAEIALRGGVATSAEATKAARQGAAAPRKRVCSVSGGINGRPAGPRPGAPCPKRCS